MSFDEGTLEVLENLAAKKRLLERGDQRHEQFRTALAVNGGALRGAYGAGHLSALYRYGLQDVFDFALSGSTGTPATSFFGAGSVLHARDVYSKECTTDRFISLRRLALWVSGIGSAYAMDIDYLCDVFRGENDRGIQLDCGALRSWRTKFYATVTTQDGRPAVLDMKRVPDPVEAIKASIAMPGLSRGNVHVEGKYYFDGDGAIPFPAAEMLERHLPTDILVLANRPRPRARSESADDRPIPSRYLQTLSPGAREAFSTKHIRFMDGLRRLRSQRGCRYLILWTDDLVGPFDRNPERLEAASLRAEEHLCKLLAPFAVQECA